MKKAYLGAILLSAVVLAGCATTGANTKADVDALNARIAAMQSQLGEKDQEIARLQGQMTSQSAQAAQLEAEKRNLNEKLDQALSDLKAAQRKPAPKPVKAADDSDLK